MVGGQFEAVPVSLALGSPRFCSRLFEGHCLVGRQQLPQNVLSQVVAWPLRGLQRLRSGQASCKARTG